MAWPMSDTSQGSLRGGRGAEGTDWRDYAACRDVDPDLFFPTATSDVSSLQIDQAKKICRTCPVSRPCLRCALDSSASGVWGGTTEDERQNHRRLGAAREIPDSRSTVAASRNSVGTAGRRAR